MFLVVDIGNSHTVTGLYDGDNLIGTWRINSNKRSTVDELAVRHHALLRLENIDPCDIQGIIISSVVPTLQALWVKYCTKHFSKYLKSDIQIVSVDKLKDLVSVRLSNPKEVGSDRLVNAVAAWNQQKSKQVVIDFGTAITFDCITEKCEYLGGAILPGIAISLEALTSRTAKLPQVDISEAPESIIGKSTVHAMKSGILFGYGAMIDGLVLGIRKEMCSCPDEKFSVIATGGMAGLITPFSNTINTIDPELTLKGLAIIYNELTK